MECNVCFEVDEEVNAEVEVGVGGLEEDEVDTEDELEAGSEVEVEVDLESDMLTDFVVESEDAKGQILIQDIFIFIKVNHHLYLFRANNIIYKDEIEILSPLKQLNIIQFSSLMHDD